MLTQDGCNERRTRLFGRLPADCGWVLVADPRHVMYLTNFWVQPLSFSNGERAAVLVERSGRATLFGDNFTLKSSATQPYADETIDFDWYNHKRSTINRDQALLKAFADARPDVCSASHGLIEIEAVPEMFHAALDEMGAKILGVELAESFVQEGTTIRDVGTALRCCRRQKLPDEVELLSACMRATEAGHKWARENVAPGKTDLEMYRGVQSAAISEAGRPAIVYGDFRRCTPASPKQGGLPVGEMLAAGDTYVLDYSVMLDGYRSDFTNTIAVGDVSDAVRKNFGTCQRAMEAGEEVLAAGVPCRDVYAAVNAAFEEDGIAGSFPHHAGHGLGLGHPEWPTLVPDSQDILLPGDVVTLEPGSYVEGVGGMRIEHNYLVTDEGYDRLSNHVIDLG